MIKKAVLALSVSLLISPVTLGNKTMSSGGDNSGQGASVDRASKKTTVRTYSHFSAPEMPAEVEEINEPLNLEAVLVGRLPCEDYSGKGVERFLKKGKHPKKYHAGRITIRASKPAIKRQLRYIDGSPGYLTVRSFQENCLNNLVRTKEQSKAAVKAAVTEQTKNLADTVKALTKKLEELEGRVQALENRAP